MTEFTLPLPPDTVIVGFDFSTGSVKVVAFDLQGDVLASARQPTDLFTAHGVSELSVTLLEGQTYTALRQITHELKLINRLNSWQLIGISATHHSAGRIDEQGNQVRRMICWNDQTLAEYHRRGLDRLGGQQRVLELTGGPWAVRYSLSHLIKDESTLSRHDWQKTRWLLPHGPLVAGFMTGRFDAISVSSAASTGMMDLRSCQWRPEMLESLADSERRDLAWSQLPAITTLDQPLGPISESVAQLCQLPATVRPWVYPTLDDQAAGLLGGGALQSGEVALILGNSAVVNSSSTQLPSSSNLDAMRTNWGPYLWMRCYNNGAQFLDRVLGENPDWPTLEKAAFQVPPGCQGISVSPFLLSEPSLNVAEPRFGWTPSEPHEPGIRLRASFEAIAALMALGVEAHEQAGQRITQLTISGGIAQSELMCLILASVLNKPLRRLRTSEGPAQGAAINALLGHELHRRRQENNHEPWDYTQLANQMIQFAPSVSPRSDWVPKYQEMLEQFRTHFLAQ